MFIPKMLCLVCTYLDLLQKARAATKMFDREGLMCYKIKPALLGVGTAFTEQVVTMSFGQ